MDRKWRALIIVCVAIFMLLLDITVVNVALPDIQKELHTSFTDLQWVVDAYALMLATVVLIAGSLGDLLGRKRVFISGVVLFTAASAVCGAATTPLVLNLVPRRPGNRRRDHVRRLARHPVPGVPRQGARHRLRDLGCDRGTRGGDRAARRRRAHHLGRLAVDLLRQRPDRHPLRRRRDPRVARVPRRVARRLRPAGLRHVVAGTVRVRARDAARQRLALGRARASSGCSSRRPC